MTTSEGRLIELPHKSTAAFSVHSKKSKKLPKGSSWIYRKQIISRNDEAMLNYDLKQRKVEQAIQEFCETDYFPLVNAIRTEFGLSPSRSHDHQPSLRRHRHRHGRDGLRDGV